MILITAALKQELGSYFDDLNDYQVLYTGIGKINATLALTRHLVNINYQGPGHVFYVLNLGTAASGIHPKGTLVRCIEFIERDMFCNLPEFKNQNPQTINMLEPNLRHFDYPVATCYTGDSFLNYFQCQNYSGVADMEAFALAKVCRHFRIPFICFKSVTDGFEDHNGPEVWRKSIDQSARLFRQIYDILRKDYG